MNQDKSFFALLHKATTNPASALKFIKRKAVTEPTRLLTGYLFDKNNRIYTRSEVATSELYPGNDELLSHCFQYQAVPLSSLKLVFDSLQATEAKHFVDIGCGRGRACFYAANKRNFTRITGVDLSELLINQANRNLRSFINRTTCKISFQHKDAREFLLPEEKCVVFLYNPFDEHIFRDFLIINMNHFRKYGSRIAYVNDCCRWLLAELGFQTDFRDNLRNISILSLH
jgi:SAM-dependent methyltransferase